MSRRLQGSPDDWFAWLVGGDEKREHKAKLILGGLEPEDPVAPEPLAERLAHTDTNVVFWAVIALSRLGQRAAVALAAMIQVAVSHPAFGVRQAALEALPKIASRDAGVKQALRYALGDESAWVRVSAVRAFIRVPDLDSSDLAAVTALERDPEEQVRHQVEITLRNIRLRGTAA